MRFRAGGRRRLASAERGEPSGAGALGAGRQQAGEPQARRQMLEIRRHLVGLLAHHVGRGEIRRLGHDAGRQRARRVDSPGQRLRRRAIGPHPHRRRGVAREGGERILVAPRVEIGRAEQVPGPAGIEERIDLLGQLEPADALFRPAEIGTGDAHRRQLVGRVGVELDRAAVMPLAQVERAPVQQNPAQRLLAFVVVAVERDRLLRVAERTVDRRVVVAAVPIAQQHDGEPGMGARIVRVAGQRLLEQPPRLGLFAEVADLGQRRMGAQHAIVGGEVGRRLALGERRAHAPGERADDGAHQLVGRGEHVLGAAVEALGPQLVAAVRRRQLRAEAQARSLPAHAARHHVIGTERLCGGAQVGAGAAMAEAGIARDHPQLPEPRQVGDDVLGEAVDQVAELGIAADIGERQHGDRRHLVQRADVDLCGRRFLHLRRHAGRRPTSSRGRRPTFVGGATASDDPTSTRTSPTKRTPRLCTVLIRRCCSPSSPMARRADLTRLARVESETMRPSHTCSIRSALVTSRPALRTR